MTFQINQIVKAKFGTFIILGFRTIHDVRCAQVKPYNQMTGQTGYGEMALTVDELTELA